ncbi:hypothetical protein DUNSADRAFT_17948 [Dunaliella salina]|uniref:Uncharacterized protein n=1 Tax=Dunaliella salina TaxID=3046 RepID=A0ABQ7H949_DUNSA|nr:hypothetical protein DUNSADRAFT_17948 [Dunaliella salina]|eukprot:KAF5843370.1 hypothetical protein DUNSADRAFT_17948 [Dunaliella salina]
MQAFERVHRLAQQTATTPCTSGRRQLPAPALAFGGRHLSSLGGNTGTATSCDGCCTCGCAARAAAVGTASGNSGTATRAHSQEIPGTSAGPRRKHHHTQDLRTAGADVGPQHEREAAAVGATCDLPHPPWVKPTASLGPQTSGTAPPFPHTAPPKVPLLCHRLRQFIMDQGVFLGKCLEHGSWTSYVWVRHSLCGFPSEHPPFGVCADRVQLVPCTQLQQLQQQGMSYGFAFPSWSFKIAGGEAVAQQQQQQQQQVRGFIGPSSASATVSTETEGVMQVCKVGAERQHGSEEVVAAMPLLQTVQERFKGDTEEGAVVGTQALERAGAQHSSVEGVVPLLETMQERCKEDKDKVAAVGMRASKGAWAKEGAHVCGTCRANLSAAELIVSPRASLEGEYRLWCGRQSNQVAFWYCCFNVSFMLVITAQSYRGGTLQVDTPSVLMWLVPYSCAAITIWTVMASRLPQVYAEVALICGNIARLLSFLSYGASMHGVPGFNPPSTSGLKALSWRAEVLNELLGGASAEQVRLPWLIPLRALTVPPLALYYSGCGYAWPLLQALVVMVLSIASSISRDICMRRSFLSSRRLTMGLGICATCKRVEH